MTTYVNTSNKGTLNLRAEPTSSGKVLARIPYGTALEVSSTTSEWVQVTYNGKTGYVMGKFLGDKPKTITQTELQQIYNSLKEALKLIEGILK